MSPEAPRLLTDEELLDWFESVRWIWAKTMAKNHPHWYCLKREQAPIRFESVVLTIWERGYDRWYLRRPWRSLDIGEDFYVWVCSRPTPGAPPPLADTILVNRAKILQDELW